MNRRLPLLLLLLILLVPARAVETSGTFVTTEPTDSSVPNWDSGWGTPGTTGWDYVGFVNGSSGVYLGNGWVLTAGHVTAGNFTLDGTTYSMVPRSNVTISNSDGTADMALFRISTSPDLSALTLSIIPPTTFSQFNPGSQAVIIGNGGGAESWGYDTVDVINQSVSITTSTTPSGSFVSNDFLTINGTLTDGSATSVNNSTLVGGDSGGADFIYNTSTHSWDLAGLNEVIGSGTITEDGTMQSITFSGMEQLSTYSAQIDSIIAVPEPSSWALLGLGLGALGWVAVRRKSAAK